MAKCIKTIFLFCLFIAVTSALPKKGQFIMDQRYVCTVKTKCVECLKLPHCSWCPTENKCFSRQLKTFDGFCSNDTINHENYGLSLNENAECSCVRNEVEQNCYPPGVTTGPVCSGRGSCTCGQCMCNPHPDPQEPSKTVMGEYCEFDNFSCEGPKCNEGPYSISGPSGIDDGTSKTAEDDVTVS